MSAANLPDLVAAETNGTCGSLDYIHAEQRAYTLQGGLVGTVKQLFERTSVKDIFRSATNIENILRRFDLLLDCGTCITVTTNHQPSAVLL